MGMITYGPHSQIKHCTNQIYDKAAGENEAAEKKKKKMGRPPGGKVALRRPVGTLFGASYDEDKWAALSIPNKLRLTHAGRIEETTSGMPRVLPCRRCVSKRKICRIYTPDAQQKYEGSSQAKRKCSWCRFEGQKCEDY